MCGLAGLWQAQPQLCAGELQALTQAMGNAIQHRGPDDQGQWLDVEVGLGLAHQRLSILDLSPLGHQPMHSADARYVLAFNGEIYNFAELRQQLQRLGHAFAGHSDTEVLLAAIVQWGLQAALERSNGMFALALWDRHSQTLSLARDRVGKKPLYYGWAGTTLVFGSELKALWRHPQFDNDINPDAVTLLLRLGYIPAPHCIHQRAFKLLPGRILQLDAAAVTAGAAAHDPELAQQPFWNAQAAMRRVLASPFQGSESEAADALDAQLGDAVGLRMVADVPVGVFLSGGTDSSVVAALMAARCNQPIRSFSIGFSGSHHDEAPLAKEVAQHLGAEHTELYVDGADALAVVPQLPAMFDEPFADASQMPTALVAKLARSGVTVALSGDGGDELFYGYGRYQRAQRNWDLLQRVPQRLRQWLAARQQPGEGARTGGLAVVLAEAGARGIGDVYRNRVSRWRYPALAVPGAVEPDSFYNLADPLAGIGGDADAMMLADFSTYLPDDLLCKVDRTSMAVGLEARAPLLDWRLAEFAWSLPMSLKYRDGVSKYLLKQVLQRYLPASMVHRPKRGFGAPVGQWLRGDLQQWAGDLLQRDRLAREGLLAPERIDCLWQAFSQGQRKWHTHLWSVLMLQAWRDHWRSQRAMLCASPDSQQ